MFRKFLYLGSLTVLFASGHMTTGSGAASAAEAYSFGPIIIGHSQKCVDVPNGSTDDNVNVNQHQCDGTSEQNFALLDRGNGYYSIVAQHSQKCLDVPNASTDNNVVINQYRCDGSPEQRYQLRPAGNGWYFIAASHSGKCLSVYNDSFDDNHVITQYDCIGRQSQMFLFSALQAAATQPSPRQQQQPSPRQQQQPSPRQQQQQPATWAPISAELSLQSGIQPGANGRNRIPISRSDPAYTVQKLDLFPAIYLDVRFADGSTAGPHDYKKNWAQNVIFDDTSGDPDDLISVVYWNVDDDNPQLGKYAAQLTSTGRGVGTAYLKVSFRNAPGVTASVPVEVVSGARSQTGEPEIIADYRLEYDGNDASGKSGSMSLQHVVFDQGALYSFGQYDDSRASTYPENWDLTDFVIYAEFRVNNDLERSRPVFITGHRWLGFYLEEDGTVSMKYNNSRYVRSNVRYNFGQWHEAYVIYENGVATFFLDDIEAGSERINFNFVNRNPTPSIGITDYSNGAVFKGWIKNLRVGNCSYINCLQSARMQ